MINNTDIQYVKGVGEKRARLFRQLGVSNLDALLHYFPRSYIDLSEPLLISEAPFGVPCTVKAKICTPITEHYVRKNLTLFKFTVTDGISRMLVTLFNAKYTAASLKLNVEYLFYGRVEGNFARREMSAPDIYPGSFSGLLPVYPASKGLTSKTIGNIIDKALSTYSIEDYLPTQIIENNKLCGLQKALYDIHRPTSTAALNKARERLVFDELFLFQLAIYIKSQANEKDTSVLLSKDYSREFAEMLPFNLTDAQQAVIRDCVYDMSCGKRLHRLVQGDVGSGKTAVCASLIFSIINNGYQAVVMAPTEILAEQHFNTFTNFYKDSKIKISLLTGSTKKAEKSNIKRALADGEIDLLICTHAVIQEDVAFKNLGLVVTDEQHRFGVAQRTALGNKGKSPHTLVLSATPIPRTLGLILYGDLDISIIDSLPQR